MTDRSDMSDDEHQARYGLVMPFVSVASKGGPFDDTAYVAGYECGQIDGKMLDESLVAMPHTVRTANLEQLDLIAMHRGFVMERGEGDDEWTDVTFKRVSNRWR